MIKVFQEGLLVACFAEWRVEGAEEGAGHREEDTEDGGLVQAAQF